MPAELITTFAWRSDDIRIVFMNPDADQKSSEWRGTSKELAEKLGISPKGW